MGPPPHSTFIVVKQHTPVTFHLLFFLLELLVMLFLSHLVHSHHTHTVCDTDTWTSGNRQHRTCLRHQPRHSPTSKPTLLLLQKRFGKGKEKHFPNHFLQPRGTDETQGLQEEGETLDILETSILLQATLFYQFRTALPTSSQRPTEPTCTISLHTVENNKEQTARGPPRD